MKVFLFIFLGGGLGSVLRYGTSKFLNSFTHQFPLGTLFVNITGSLIIGLLLGVAMKNNSLSNEHLLFLTVGFCGGFTTFSAFAVENLSLLKNGDYTSFVLYSIGSILLSLLAVFWGFRMVTL